MPVGPIHYRGVRDLLREVSEREQHPLPRLLSEFLLSCIADLGADEDLLASAVGNRLSNVIECCCRLSTDLIERRQHPVVPADPREQERLWHEAEAELLRWYDYHDITAQVRDWYARDAAARGKPSLFDYRAIYQSAERVQYARTLADLLIVLDTARQTAAKQPQDETDTPREEDDDVPRR